MKKSTMIILIVLSSVLILGATIAGGIMAVQRLGPMIQKSIEEESGTQEAEESAEDKINKALKEMAGKHDAVQWTKDLKTNYSYEVRDKAAQLPGKTVLLSGSLSDITRENGTYFLHLQDENLSGASFYTIYKIRCTEGQVKELTAENPGTSGSYGTIYVVAAKVDSMKEVPREEGDLWSTRLILYGSLLEARKLERPSEY